MKILCCCNNPAVYTGMMKYYENLGHTFDIVHSYHNLDGVKPKDYDIVLSTKFFAGGSLVLLQERGFNCINLDTCGSIRDAINSVLNIEEKEEPKVIVPKTSAKQKVIRQEKSYFVGKSLPYQQLYSRIKRFSPLVSSFLLFGKTGTGKEHTAREIHQASGVSGKFVSIDCGAITDELINSELFGHIKGSFTGATQDKSGYFEEANGGTLFFDEIENLSYKGQLALLRVLQERSFKKVGSTKEQIWEAKIICATNVDLQKEVEKGRFRSDLFYRINQVTLQVPSLEDVMDDIPDLIDFLVKEINEEYNQSFEASEEFKSQTIEQLIPFKGNVRELKSYLFEKIINTDIELSTLSGIELLQNTRKNKNSL